MRLDRLAAKLVKVLPQMEGASGRMTIGAKQLEQMAQRDPKAGEILQELIRGTKNPSLDIAYKAKSNYSIAGIKIRDGKKVIGNGAVSITNPGKPDAVLKYRAAIDGGKKLRTNGFIDGGQYPTARDVNFGFTRRNGNLTVDFTSGKAFAEHLQVNEQFGAGILGSMPNGTKAINEYYGAMNKLHEALNKGMKHYRGLVSGVQTPPPPIAKVEVPPLKEFKLASGFNKVPDEIINKAANAFDEEFLSQLKKVQKKDVDFKKVMEKYLDDFDKI